MDPAVSTLHTARALNSRKLPRVDVQVSVVIPCRNEAPYVAGMLDALRAQDCAIDEVIIVDGGSADGTMEVVREYGSRHPDFPLRVVTAYGANIPAAVNAGIHASRSGVIVRMDSHSRPAADYIRRVLQANNRNVSRSARALGLSRVMLQKKMKEYGLRDE